MLEKKGNKKPDNLVSECKQRERERECSCQILKGYPKITAQTLLMYKYMYLRKEEKHLWNFNCRLKFTKDSNCNTRITVKMKQSEASVWKRQLLYAHKARKSKEIKE